MEAHADQNAEGQRHLHEQGRERELDAHVQLPGFKARFDNGALATA
jgi:hypothetical protein